MTIRYMATQHVPQEILDAGTWMAEQVGMPRKQVFRQYTSPSLVRAHEARDPGLAEKREREVE